MVYLPHKRVDLLLSPEIKGMVMNSFKGFDIPSTKTPNDDGMTINHIQCFDDMGTDCN